jgi:ABC-type glycerol-3-phosphate transport system substrate-binding protein
MKKRLSIILVLAVLSLLVLPACGLTSDMSNVGDAGKAFMTALRDGDHQASWKLLTPAVQEEIGGYDNWVAFATPRNFETFSFNSTNVENNQAQLDGEATLGSDTYLVTLVFDKSSDEWLISGINFSLK